MSDEEECVCNICSNTFNNSLLTGNNNGNNSNNGNNTDNNDKKYNNKKHNYNLRSNNSSNLGHKVQLNCGHLFHYWCIKQWYIKIKNNKCRIGMGRYNERQCPYCRSYGGYLVIPDYDNDFVVGVNIKGIS